MSYRIVPGSSQVERLCDVIGCDAVARHVRIRPGHELGHPAGACRCKDHLDETCVTVSEWFMAMRAARQLKSGRDL